jgi:mitogen-activated protein kinase 1/3
MVRELILLRALSHCPFVTKILDIIEPQSISHYRDLYFVMEYVESDLKKIIKSSLILSELHVQVIVYNLLCGLKWVHQT